MYLCFRNCSWILSSSKMATNYFVLIVSFCCVLYAETIYSIGVGKSNPVQSTTLNESQEQSPPSCTCGVFLSDQFVKGSSKPPTENPPITKEIDDQVTCNSLGVKQCITRCIESLVSFMPKSSELICASMDRNVFKQRAFLFVNNCNQGWFNTKFSAGRQFCCKDGEFYKCPTV